MVHSFIENSDLEKETLYKKIQNSGLTAADLKLHTKQLSADRKKINQYIEKVKEKRVKKKAEMVELLKNSYIKGKIKKQTGVPYEHITQDLIETKRLHILIKRKLKDLTK